MDANEEQNSTEISGADNQHEEFEREKYPNKEDNEGDNNQFEFQGVTLKGKSRKYIQAYNKLKKC